ncbi:hypothetical protein LG329_19515 (plasmid) [Virgibacillus necropolis]|uniref:hypothetical protein n=1 Tax=Virgibacillus necropolis TaxID=163877 RepID=UPI00384F1268
MKTFAEKFLLITEKIRNKMLGFIDWLAKKDIEESNREYELRFGQQLNESEKVEIKKDAVIRLWKYMALLLLLLIFLLSQLRGCSF